MPEETKTSQDDKIKKVDESPWSPISEEVVGLHELLDNLAKDEPESESVAETSQEN